MARKKKIPSFRKGMIVIGTNNTVLVTGAGDRKTAGYPVFAGVVVGEGRSDSEHWPVGMYSETWTSCAFKKSGLSMKKIIKEATA